MRPSPESGFTLVEVLVAIVILLVGVLGVVALIDGASAVTVKNQSREGATNVQRSIVEVGRAVRYRDLSTADLYTALNARPGLADARPAPGHTIEARGYLYDVSLTVCSMDDPRDGLALADPAVAFCPESTPAASASVARDRNPDDYKRISVALTWKRSGMTETARQTSIVSNPVGGLGPSIAELKAVGYSGVSVNVFSASVLNFTVTTTTDAAQVDWSLQGAPQGKANAVGASERDFTFAWDLDGTTGGQYWWDCTYIVQADAYDDQGRSGKPGAITVVLNRRQAFAPGPLEGGRNGDVVDLRWAERPECDVLGYHVERRVAAGAWEQVTCLGQAQPTYTDGTTCVDEDPPTPSEGTLQYRVAAVDTNSAGALRNGDFTSELTIVEGNLAPSAPTGLAACLGGTPGCNGPNGEPASDGVTALSWSAATDPDGSIYLYRIYRDGTSYSDRAGVFYTSSTGGDLAWIDPETPDGQSHTYHVTAVDEHYAESPLSAGLPSFP